MNYDLLVMGGGPAGYLAAERAGHAGLNTLLVEKRNIGGVCLNEGCIPSKALLYSAKLYDTARQSQKYGVTVEKASLDHRVVLERKNKVVKTLVAGVKATLKKNRVTVVEGEAFISGKTADGFSVRVADQEYQAARLLIATGSLPVLHKIPGLDEGLKNGFVLTSREILDINMIPESLVVIGAGVIGLELASYFNSAGSRVTMVELLPFCAGNTDRDISETLRKEYEKKGITFVMNARVTDISAGIEYEKDGKKERIKSDKILLATGRKPVTEGFGLENTGVETEAGRIKTDLYLRTNIPGIWAAGDVNGISMLAHTAYREADVAVSCMLGKKDIMRYHAIPNVIYTNPEVASVGETEESAQSKGIPFEVQKLSMRYSGRFLAENEGGDGICKVLVEKNKRTLLGVHMLSNASSEIIYGAALMVESQMRVKDIRQLVFPHPTVSEIIREAVFQF
ncbi:MAG: dihydrolipoyl dehydrogenase [Spirochaetaceae bacterium]|nr:MAG: dihydrolipoyl dehydrogenase [Spirochaetaceae bacterium]